MPDEAKKKWAQCVNESTTALISGLVIGTITSIILVQDWPFVLGFSFALGWSYKTCDEIFNPQVKKKESPNDDKDIGFD